MTTISCRGCGKICEHSPENFYRSRGKLHKRCKQCHNAIVKKWHKAHPEHYENYQKKWVKESRAADIEKWRQREFRQGLRKMGKTVEWFEKQLAEQFGLCAICEREEVEVHPRTKKVQRLSVDHDHRCCPGVDSCGKCVRGIICAKCNQCLHQLEHVPDWADKAIGYLARYHSDTR